MTLFGRQFISLHGRLAAGVLLLAVASSCAHADGFTTSVTTGSHFYRLLSSYMHGNERVDFDIVVGCSIRATDYQDNEHSFDAVRDPLIFAKATEDGGAIMQIVSNACEGETTENGLVPQDFLPGVVWFDKKSDLSFGIGYVSEDAFSNPVPNSSSWEPRFMRRPSRIGRPSARSRQQT
jgi:hypothetical protein